MKPATPQTILAVFALIHAALYIAVVTNLFFQFSPLWLLLIAGLSLITHLVFRLFFRNRVFNSDRKENKKQ